MRLLSVVLILLLSPVISLAQTVRIGVPETYNNTILNIGLAEGYSNTLQITQTPELDAPELKDIQRISMEMLIICKALYENGVANEIRIEPFPNIDRAKVMLLNGSLDVLATSLFDLSLNEVPELLRSEPVILEGDFVVGLFTTANRKDVLRKHMADDYSDLTAITVSSWHGDFRTMKALGPKRIVLVPKRTMLANLIEEGRADFTFSYLAEPIVTRNGGELIRIPKVKATIKGNRHFAISPNRPDIQKALNKYLKRMRSGPEDLIRKALIYAGFIATGYDDWVDVMP